MTFLNKLSVTLLAILVFSISGWATNSDKVKKEAGEAVDAAGEYASQNKEEFMNEMRENVKTIEGDIKDLKKQATKMSGSARESLNNQIAELEKKRDSFKKDLGELGDTSGRAWTQMREGVNRAWGDVKTAYNKAVSEFDRKMPESKKSK